MGRTWIAVVWLTLFAPGATVSGEEPRLWSTLDRGPFEVGLRMLRAESMMLLPSIPTREIEIAVWYPAAPTDARALTFGDYLRLSPDLVERSSTEGAAIGDLHAALSVAISGSEGGVPRELAQAILASPMAARLDAEEVAGDFPLVLWSSRYGTTAAQSVLSEYLASHGYVVGFGRPAQERWRLPFETTGAAERAAEIAAQVLDLRGGLRALRAMAAVDSERAAVLAWSYSGEAATRLQRTDRRIDLVIGLDTNTLSGSWPYQGVEALAALGAGPLEVPHAMLGSATKADGTALEPPPAWQSLPANSAFIAIPGTAHGTFNVVEGLIPAAWGIGTVQPWAKAGPEGEAAYVGVAQAVRALLDHHLLGASLSSARLESLLPRGSRVELRERDGGTPVAPQTLDIPSGEGVALTADLYSAGASPRACVALFHQSGSSRGEYRGIAPWLAGRGFTALAVDLRMGGQDRWNDVPNESTRRSGANEARERGDEETVRRLRAEIGSDLRAVIDWLARQPGCAGRVVPWGSSFSANEVLAAAAVAEDVLGVVAFSPGEYDPSDPEKARRLASKLLVPAFIAWGRDEAELSAPIAQAVRSRTVTYPSLLGFHGSSILYDDAAAWPPLAEFLDSLADGEKVESGTPSPTS